MQGVVQLYGIYIDVFVVGVDQMGVFVGVGVEWIFDCGNVQVFVFVLGCYVGQFVVGGQLFGGGDCIGVGVVGVYCIVQVIMCSCIFVLVVGVEVVILYYCFVLVQFVVGGGFFCVGGIIGRWFFVGFW